MNQLNKIMEILVAAIVIGIWMFPVIATVLLGIREHKDCPALYQ